MTSQAPQSPVRPDAARRLHRVDTVAMDTWVNIQVVSSEAPARVEAAIWQALRWIGVVEKAASRFNPDSEVVALARTPGRAMPVSPLLFEATDFALQLARVTGGAFDPTIGSQLARRGFATNYRTGVSVDTALGHAAVSYRDVLANRRLRTITLRRALILDLGAIAKGLAVDLVARDLTSQGFLDFSVDAGGDIFAHGHNLAGQPWQIGIQHPRAADSLITTIPLSDGAVCTSGDYERQAPDGSAHILDARSGLPTALASVSVRAPTAMAADGLSTAVMLLGRERGLRLLRKQGVDGLLVNANGTLHSTPGFVDGTP